MSDIITSPFDWWSARRLRYNVALACAGILAFVAYLMIGSTLLPRDAGFEVTMFSILFQSVGYLCMMGLANIFYFLGPLSERILRLQDPERYRRICFRLGLWVSVSLPFSIPALLLVSAVFQPR